VGLTTLVSELWETVYQEQGSGRRLQPGGSLLWSRNWGWCVTETVPAQTYRCGYVHL